MSYVGADEQTAKISIKGMVTQLAINFAMGAGTLIIFGVLRPRNGIVYAPKQKYSSEKKQPPKIDDQGIFSWLKPVLSSKEGELLEKIGLDAVMFLRFIAMCRNMFLWLFLMGLAVVGVNVYGTTQDRKGFPKTDNPLKYLSISFLRQSKWFWAHVGFTWVFTFLVIGFLYKQYKEYAKLKVQYFQSEEYQRSLHSRTLMVTGVPSHMQSDEGLRKYITEKLKIKTSISQIHISRKVGRLPELISEHDQSVRKLEAVLVKYLKDPNNISSKRPKHNLGGMCSGQRVDSIEYYTAQIQRFEEEINHERELIKEKKAINYGFVSFTNIPDAHSVAKKVEGKVNLGEPEIMLAPWPKDIVWKNLVMTPAVRRTKRLFGYGFFMLLCFFWVVPMGLLTTAAQIQNIVQVAPFTERFVYANDYVTGLIEAWMSPLIMALFFLILPGLLRILSKQQGKLTKSSLDRSVLSKLYLFFIVNSIVIYTVSSTAFDLYAKIKATINAGNTEFKDFYNVVREAEFLDQLADSLIKVSTFWINYISLRGVGAIFDLAQIFSLVVTNIKRLFVQPTPRNIKEFSRPPDFDYPVYYNVHLFFFTIGLLYSVIAPLILLFCFLYFALALLVYRYQLMYVFTTKIETGGTFWKVVFNRLIASLIFWQAIMIGVMNLKGAHVQSVALFPLPIIALLVKIICFKRFDASIRYYKSKGSDPEYHNNGYENDRVSSRFGHPALTTELITPMVHSNVKHLLSRVYNGRIDETKVNRRGTIKSMSMIVSNNQKLGIQTVEANELEWDEQAYYEEQKPGYYIDYNDAASNYSGLSGSTYIPPTPASMNFPPKHQQQQQQQQQFAQLQQQQRQPPPQQFLPTNLPNNSSEFIELQHASRSNSPRSSPNPSNHHHHNQQRPIYSQQSGSTRSLHHQPSIDNYSIHSNDTSSTSHYRQENINYNNNHNNGNNNNSNFTRMNGYNQRNNQDYNQNQNYYNQGNSNNHNHNLTQMGEHNQRFNQDYNQNHYNQGNNHNHNLTQMGEYNQRINQNQNQNQNQNHYNQGYGQSNGQYNNYRY